MAAYLQFGSADNPPMQTVSCEWREDMPARKRAALVGFGNAIPSNIQIQFEGRWRRVYVTRTQVSARSWVRIEGEKIPVLFDPGSYSGAL